MKSTFKKYPGLVEALLAFCEKEKISLAGDSCSCLDCLGRHNLGLMQRLTILFVEREVDINNLASWLDQRRRLRDDKTPNICIKDGRLWTNGCRLSIRRLIPLLGEYLLQEAE